MIDHIDCDIWSIIQYHVQITSNSVVWESNDSCSVMGIQVARCLDGPVIVFMHVWIPIGLVLDAGFQCRISDNLV